MSCLAGVPNLDDHPAVSIFISYPQLGAIFSEMAEQGKFCFELG